MLQNPTHQYSNSGVYTVRLTVTDDDGATHFVEHDVTVTAAGPLFVDSELSDSVDSADLRDNSPSQDWYESRGSFSGGDTTLLTLDTSDIGGNTNKKAALKNYDVADKNAYLTQNFTPQTDIFNLSFDIYIDIILDNPAYPNFDRTGHIYIGNDAVTTNAPAGTADERFVTMVFYDPTPGDTGNDIEIRARTYNQANQTNANTALWPQVVSGLSYDTWYNVKIIINFVAGSYDVYVNGVYKATISKMFTYNNQPISYICFAVDGSGRGDFYIDNIFSPVTIRYALTTNVIGSGLIVRDPGESTYAKDSTVELTAVPNPGWEFVEWSGSLTGSTNPETLTMDDNKTVTATFRDSEPPVISNVLATPASISQGGNVNITCDVTDNIEVDEVKVVISGPVGFDPVNATMTQGSHFYFDVAYMIAGTYNYHVWADDTSDNGAASATYQFTVIASSAPIIIDNSADTAGTGDSFVVTATITDSDGMDAAYLEYWFDGGTKTNIPLDNTAGDTWEYNSISIPVDSTNPLYYNISAKDVYDTWSALINQQVTVLDDDAPVISNVLATPVSIEQGEEVNITCDVTDNIGVNLVKVDISGPVGFTPVNATMTLGDHYYYNTVYTIVGTYSYHIWANDANANQAISTTYQFTVTGYDDVIFDSDFEMGNLKNVQYENGDSIGNRYYTAEIDYSTVTFSEMLWWFHFSMQNTVGKNITIELQNLPPKDFGLDGGKPRWQTMWPVYSYDYVTWSRIPLENISWDSTALNFSMTIEPTQDTIWLAPSPPYTLTMRDAFLDAYAGSSYLETYSLGTTPLGLNLPAITITDPTVPDEDKYKVYIISTQHSGETVPTYVTEGMIAFLLDETNTTAQLLRKNCVFKIIPIVNVEGTYYGYGRYTPFRSGIQYDLNRQWNLEVSSMQPEIQWIFSEIQIWSPDVFIDLHDDSISDDCFFYKGGTHTSTYKLMDAIATYWPETDTSRLTTSQSAGQIYNRLGIYASVLMEHPHDTLTDADHNPQTIADWKLWGKGIANGISDYFNLSKLPLLVDSEFSDSIDSADLQLNSTEQDWYESRGLAISQLTLNTTNVGGNNEKKAALNYYGLAGNYFVYLTQEFGITQPGVFNVSMDMYIDRIQDDGENDRTGFIFVGDDSDASGGPCSTGVDRFIQLVFYDPTPGDTGDDLEIRAREYNNPTTLPSPAVNQPWTTTSTWTLVKDGLSYDTWYTIQLVIDAGSDTYDVYVDGVIALADINKYEQFNAARSLTHISFSAGYQAKGDFLVDNVFSPIADRHRLDTTVIGSGSIVRTPGESTYANGTSVELTAIPEPGWAFVGWSGSLAGLTNPETLTMDADKAVTATFQDSEQPAISNVLAAPSSTLPGGFINITCDVTDNMEVDLVKAVVIGPVGFTPVNATMQPGINYYYNATYSIAGTYDYYIWANDTSDNGVLSATYHFAVTESLSIDVSMYWNLISIPVYDTITTADIIVRYEGHNHTWSEAISEGIVLNTLYDWQRGLTQSYNPTDTLVSGNGYWMWAYHDCELLITSEEVGNGHITNLQTKWNIMGLPYEDSLVQTLLKIEYPPGTTLNWDEAVSGDIILGFIYGWDSATQMYSLETTLEPGQGYWMYAYYDCILKKEVP